MRGISRIVVLGLLIGAVAALAGCSSPGKSTDAGDLKGTQWGLVGSSLNSADLSAARITANFEDAQVSGFSGVNQYTGPYTADADGSFKAGPLAGTLMAGPSPLMAAETAYLKLFEGCDSYKVAGGKLTLFTGGNETLSYEAVAEAGLPGSRWVVTGHNNGREAVVGTAPESTLTVEFTNDGRTLGDAGVNTFNGDYQSDKTTIKIGPLATTEMAGTPELMAQETEYLAALQNSATWEITNGTLTMRDAGGATQIVANERR